MSYTLTLDMPRDAVEFAERRFVGGNAELSALFLAFLIERLGYRPKETADVRSGDESCPVTDSLSGIIRLPDGVDDHDLLAQGMLEKYESIS